MSCPFALGLRDNLRIWRSLALRLALFVPLLAVASLAKDVPLNAIALFDGPNGPSYVQLTGVTINSRLELRNCTGVSKIDRKNYGSLPKVQLRGASTLERGTNGALTMTDDSGPMCVVPGVLGFEKTPEMTPAEAADQVTLQGTVVSSSTGQPVEAPDFKPG